MELTVAISIVINYHDISQYRYYRSALLIVVSQARPLPQGAYRFEIISAHGNRVRYISRVKLGTQECDHVTNTPHCNVISSMTFEAIQNSEI